MIGGSGRAPRLLKHCSFIRVHWLQDDYFSTLWTFWPPSHEATGGHGLSVLDHVSELAGPQLLPQAELRIRLNNSAQARHLCQALLGHCDVDILPDTAGTALVVNSPLAGTRPILRRLDAWLTEFGVDSISLDLNGSSYQLRKSPRSPPSHASALTLK